MSYQNRNRSASRRTAGTGPRANKYAANCATCGTEVAAGRGLLTGGQASGWKVTHRPAEWSGSPVSGWYVNGCPEETAAQNARGGWGPETARTYTAPAAPSELVWCEADDHPVKPHELAAECEHPFGSGTYAGDAPRARTYAYTASGERMTMGSQRCEDAPCCGCC